MHIVISNAVYSLGRIDLSIFSRGRMGMEDLYAGFNRFRNITDQCCHDVFLCRFCSDHSMETQ